ncbi:hypothetical protein [Sodalis praecaptivus]
MAAPVEGLTFHRVKARRFVARLMIAARLGNRFALEPDASTWFLPQSA